MSAKITQLPDPVNILDTDLFYLGRSPYTAGQDYAATGAEFKTLAANAAPVQSVNGQTGVVTGLIDTAGTGLTKTGTTLSITNTGVASDNYGSATQVPVLGINAQGQIINAANVSIDITSTQVSDFNSAADARITNAINTNVVQEYNGTLQGLANFGASLPGVLAITGVSGGVATYHTAIGTDTSNTTYNNLSDNVQYTDTINFNSSSTKTFTLDNTGLSVGYHFFISNSGSGTLNFSAVPGNTIYGYSTIPGGGGSIFTTPRAKVELINISATPVWYISSANDFNLVAGGNINFSRSATGLTINYQETAITESTTARTLQPSDAGATILCTNSGTTTITIDTNANQPIPVGSVIRIMSNGSANSLVNVVSSGVPVINNGVNLSVGLHGFIVVQKTNTNVWNVLNVYDQFSLSTTWNWGGFTTASNYTALFVRNMNVVTVSIPIIPLQTTTQNDFLKNTTAFPARFINSSIAFSRDIGLRVLVSGVQALSSVALTNISAPGTIYIGASPSGNLSGTSIEIQEQFNFVYTLQ